MWATHFIKVKNQRKPKLVIKLKRVPIEVTVTGFESAKIKGHLLLNDITFKGIAIYTSTRLTEGQEVTIKLQEPKEFSLKGDVAFCVENLSDSHIVSENVYTQRTGVIHKFENEEEKQKFFALLAEMHVKYMGIVPDAPTETVQASAPALAAVPDPVATPSDSAVPADAPADLTPLGEAA